MKQNIIKKFGALLMICIVGLYILNDAFYAHRHVLMDGTVITHAHPYDKAGDSLPVKTHHHSNSEFHLLKHLKLLFVFTAFSWSFILFAHAVIQYSFDNNIRLQFSVLYTAGRAPPSI